MGRTLAFARALVATNLKAAFALRGAFWMQVVFMFLNNGIFFTFWWLAFRQVDEIGGWRLPDLCALYGLVAGSFGISIVLFGGARDLARTISDGELDALLTQPKPVMLQAAAGRSMAAGWGDLGSGVALVALSGYLHGWTWLLVPFLMACGALTFAATTVIIHSAAFWAGPVNTMARQVVEWMLTVTVYPATIYSGAVRWLMFLVLPAAFVSQLPVTLLREFHWWTVATIALGTAAYVVLAMGVFKRGLRVYTSGNRFTARV